MSAALDDSNRRLETYRRIAAIVSTSSDAIYSKTLEGTITSWNLAAEALFGYSAREIVGRSVSRLLPPDRPDEMTSILERIGRGERVKHFTTVRVRKDGGTVPVSLSVSPILGAKNRVIGAASVARDMTEELRVEHGLREAAEYARSLIEASLDPLVTVSPGGKVTDVNEATLKVTGRRRSEIIGTDFSDYFTEPGTVRAGLRRAFEEGSVVDYPLTLRHRDGRLTDVLYNASVYRDSDGKVRGVFAAARDVTARRRAEHEVRTLNAELEARVAARTAELARSNNDLQAFTSTVSHDLRAPLRALSGFTQMLAEDYGTHLDERGRDYTRRIRGAAEHMGELIDDLLEFSRVGRAPFELEDVDLSAEAARIAADLKRSDPARGVRFRIEDGVRAVGDKILVAAVLENLLDNAWKFTAGSENPEIEFGAQHENGDGKTRVVYYVRDNGVGFDMAYADELFQPFHRLHGREFVGTGIGLASVSRIVERHGGTTWAQASVGKGATFYFTLGADEPS